MSFCKEFNAKTAGFLVSRVISTFMTNTVSANFPSHLRR